MSKKGFKKLSWDELFLRFLNEATFDPSKEYEIVDKQEIELLRKYLEIGEEGKHILRRKGYGWTGLDICETCKLVPENEE